MTESEWDNLTEWHEVLATIPTPLNARKARLWVVALCRCVPPATTEPEVLTALSVIEGFVDNRTTSEAYVEAMRLASYATYASMYNDQVAILASDTEDDRLWTCPLGWVDYPVDSLVRNHNVPATSLLRDIFGSPFRPVAFSPDWRTDTALTLARTMYESRDFSAMPILADALQDAGCDNDDILAHCRDPLRFDSNAPHVRGCWVVDLVLGKE